MSPPLPPRKKHAPWKDQSKDSSSSPSRLNFSSWIDLLKTEVLDPHQYTLFLQGLQTHPEWLNQQETPHQQTALMLASSKGFINIVQDLIQAGADLNLQNRWGWTALIEASYLGRLEVVSELIQAGADLHLQDDLGRNALILSVLRNHLDVVKTLLHHPVDLMTQDDKGCTALMAASSRNFMPMMIELLQHPQVFNFINLQNQEGQTALMLAINSFKTEALCTLIQSGADLNLQDQNGYTALMLATHSFKIEALRVLIQSGADVNLQNKKGNTALILACQEDSAETVQCLLEAGADPDHRNLFQETAQDFVHPMANPLIMRLLETYTTQKQLDQTLDRQQIPQASHSSNRDDSSHPPLRL